MTRARIIALLITSLAAGARSATVRIRVDVTATVVSNCRLTVFPLSFGIYDPLAANAAQPADGSTSIVLNCTRGSNAAVSFDLGLHSAGSIERGMAGPGSDHLRYQIYRDANRSLIWTQGLDAARVTSRGVSHPDQLSVFGRIPPGQEVAPGAYSDQLTATVDF